MNAIDVTSVMKHSKLCLMIPTLRFLLWHFICSYILTAQLIPLLYRGNLSSTIENASQHGIMDYESALLPLHNIIQFPQFNFQIALLDDKPQ